MTSHTPSSAQLATSNDSACPTLCHTASNALKSAAACPALCDAAASAILCASVFSWYAMPDVIRHRPLRVISKIGLTASMAAVEVWRSREAIAYAKTLWQGEANDTDPTTLTADNTPDPSTSTSTSGTLPTPTTSDTLPTPSSSGTLPNNSPLDNANEPTASLDPRLLIGGGMLIAAGATAASIAAERWVFRRGERRRAAGTRNAHARQAIWIAAAVAAIDLIDHIIEKRSTTDEHITCCPDKA